jgi:hypothetical protein
MFEVRITYYAIALFISAAVSEAQRSLIHTLVK